MTRKTKKSLYNIVVILLIVSGLIWVCEKFVHLGNVEYTDNAQVKQLIVPVNSRIQGFISEVRFDEYRPVHKGDTLVLIEDTEFLFRLAQAEADYQNALSGKSAMILLSVFMRRIIKGAVTFRKREAQSASLYNWMGVAKFSLKAFKLSKYPLFV